MLYFLQNLLELIKVYLFFRRGMHFKVIKRKYVYLLDLLALTLFTGFMVWGQQHVNPIVPYFLFVVVTSLITYEGNRIKLIGISLWLGFVLGLIDGISAALVAITTRFFNVNNEQFCDMFGSIVTVLFMGICMEILNRKSKRALEDVSIGYFIFLGIITFFNQISISIMWDLFEEREKGYYLIALFLSLGVFTQIVMFLLLAASQQLNKEKIRMNERFLKAQQEHYQYLEKKERETKKFRHDIRGHMYTIRELSEENPAILKYIERVFGKIDDAETSYSIGNGIADAILNQAAVMCKERDVTFKVSGQLPSDCSVEPYDLCVIFSNLLQNAIEAAEQCEKGSRRVNLQVRYDKDLIMIRGENTMNGTLKFYHKELMTTKKIKEGHGYGMRNIVESVDNYAGKTEYHAEDGTFQIQIILKMK